MTKPLDPKACEAIRDEVRKAFDTMNSEPNGTKLQNEAAGKATNLISGRPDCFPAVRSQQLPAKPVKTGFKLPSP